MSKIMIQAVDDLAEGVYMASGVALEQTEPFTQPEVRVVQRSNEYDENNKLMVSFSNLTDHDVGQVWITLSFNVNVEPAWQFYSECQGAGTSVLSFLLWANIPAGGTYSNDGFGIKSVAKGDSIDVVSTSVMEA